MASKTSKNAPLETIATNGAIRWQPMLASGAVLSRGRFLDEELGFERWEKCWSDRTGSCGHPYPVLYRFRWMATIVAKAEENRRRRIHRRAENRMLASFHGDS